MDSRTISIVLFDLDDTLHDDTRAFVEAAQEVAGQVAAEHGIDALALKNAYVAQAHGFWSRLSAEHLENRLGTVREALWHAALKDVGLSDIALAERSAERYNACRKRHFTPFPGALELLRELRESGKKLGLVTNGFSETHREKIELLQLGQAFDAVFIADEVGMLKPDPLLFTHACTTLGGLPQHAAMVGDRYDRDIIGALAAGLYTIWLNVRDETLPPGVRPPNAVCRNIAEVGPLLEAASR